jgi:OOP family OmpA-OmpF porin
MAFDALAMIAAAAVSAQPVPATPQLSCGAAESSPGAADGPPYDVFMIFFDRDSAAITSDAARTLENAAQVYRRLPHCQLNVWAHTDRLGSDAYNLTLSARRGRAVVAYMRHLGVLAAPRIEAHGETRLLVDTADGVAEPQNRRAEIIIGRPGGP